MKIRLCTILVFITLSLNAQQGSYRIAFYNVENLFAKGSSYGYDDTDNLPPSATRWDNQKHQTKLSNIAHVIRELHPQILGLCEIDNPAVLRELLSHPDLKNTSYEYIHLDTKDNRGIDPALIYRSDAFKVLDYRSVESPLNSRGVLYVKGLAKVDTLHLMINHWTSRYMGRKATEAARIDMGRLLCELSDSILKHNPKAKILIMGDMNDSPEDRSVKLFFECAKSFSNHSDSKLTPTYYFEKQWFAFDQIYSNFIDKKQRVSVFKPDYILNSNGVPLRTYQGPIYLGGFSDHLPLYIEYDLTSIACFL